MVAPLKARYEELIAALSPPPADESEVAALYDQLLELRSFTDAIRELRTADDPTGLLVPAYDEHGQAIPGAFEHRVGRWVGYWLVDDQARVCTGVLVRHDLDPATDTLRRVLDDP